VFVVLSLYLPALQSEQPLALDLYLPGPQAVQDPAADPETLPDGQLSQFVVEVEYFPAAQAVHEPAHWLPLAQ
jgi:hypothetical protein